MRWTNGNLPALRLSVTFPSSVVRNRRVAAISGFDARSIRFSDWKSNFPDALPHEY